MSSEESEMPDETEETDGGSDTELSHTSPTDGSEISEYDAEAWTWQSGEVQDDSSTAKSLDTDHPDEGRDTVAAGPSEDSEPAQSAVSREESDGSDGLSDEERIERALTEFDPSADVDHEQDSETQTNGLLSRLLGVWLRQWWRQAFGKTQQTSDRENAHTEGSVGIAVGGEDVGRDDG